MLKTLVLPNMWVWGWNDFFIKYMNTCIRQGCIQLIKCIIYNVWMFWLDCNFFSTYVCGDNKKLFFFSLHITYTRKLHIRVINFSIAESYTVKDQYLTLSETASVHKKAWTCDFDQDFGGLMQRIFHACFAGVLLCINEKCGRYWRRLWLT